jgi:IclR family acetate operon transcriptional repressor
MPAAEILMDRSLAPEGERASPYTIRAVDRTLDILDCLQLSPAGVSLGELSQVVGLPKSSTFRYLATLEARGYVARDPDETYRLGHGWRAIRPRDVSLLAAVARPWMEELCRRFDETINLAALDGTKVAYLRTIESSHPVRFAARPGHVDFVHSSALGKALASRLAVDEIRRIFELEGMPAMTSRTITDFRQYLVEIDGVRKRGYAINDLENDNVGRCVAVALPGRLVTAVGLSAPAARFPVERASEFAAALKRIADDIAAEVGRARA